MFACWQSFNWFDKTSHNAHIHTCIHSLSLSVAVTLTFTFTLTLSLNITPFTRFYLNSNCWINLFPHTHTYTYSHLHTHLHLHTLLHLHTHILYVSMYEYVYVNGHVQIRMHWTCTPLLTVWQDLLTLKQKIGREGYEHGCISHFPKVHRSSIVQEKAQIFANYKKAPGGRFPPIITSLADVRPLK